MIAAIGKYPYRLEILEKSGQKPSAGAYSAEVHVGFVGRTRAGIARPLRSVERDAAGVAQDTLKNQSGFAAAPSAEVFERPGSAEQRRRLLSRNHPDRDLGQIGMEASLALEPFAKR